MKRAIGNQTSSAQGTGRECATSIQTSALTLAPNLQPQHLMFYRALFLSCFPTYHRVINSIVPLTHVYVLALTYLSGGHVWLSAGMFRAFQMLVQSADCQSLLENSSWVRTVHCWDSDCFPVYLFMMYS